MSVATSVVLGQARSLLNDITATNWTDATLIPLLQLAHQELQAQLRLANAPVMKGLVVDQAVAADAITITSPANCIEPIKVWERPQSGGSIANYTLMTEVDDLPLIVPGTNNTIGNWQWQNEIINIVGSSVAEYVRIWYWKSITLPVLNTDLVGFINAELYLSPRTAAIAAASVGNDALNSSLSQLALTGLSTVILANRGRVKPTQGMALRP